MRETAPEQFNEYSVVDFYPALAGTAHARFDMLATTHGDGRSYSWKEGGGEYLYTVSKTDEYALVDGFWTVNVWDFVVEDKVGGVLMLKVDCINSKILDVFGNEVGSEQVNRVFRAILDASYEREERDKSVKYFPGPDGVLRPNMYFEPMTALRPREED